MDNINFRKEFLREVEVEANSKLKPVSKELLSELKAHTPIDTGEARDGWELLENPLRLINEVEHITNLNAGSSQQAPSNFIELTLLSDPAVSANGNIVSYS